MDDSTPLGPNPSGLCMCGCGQKTAIAHVDWPMRGHVKGQPKRYLVGHHARKSPVDYIEQDCGYDTPCWVWQLCRDAGTGYGRIGGQWAHRVYYERHVGPIPEGLQLDHLCRNHACVNPAHLEPVTEVENHRRAITTKLTAMGVRVIYRLHEMGWQQKEIAEAFGMHPAHISRIVNRRAWKGVAA